MYIVEAGIDEDIFPFINDQMLSQLFLPGQCGFQQKFNLKYEAWKNNFSLNSSSSSLLLLTVPCDGSFTIDSTPATSSQVYPPVIEPEELNVSTGSESNNNQQNNASTNACQPG